MKKIRGGYILPSAAITVPVNRIRNWQALERTPRMGDLAYGVVTYLGQHVSLENRQGRIHSMHDGSRAIFVFGNRYAPDYYEGLVPEKPVSEVSLLARSGIVGDVVCKSALVADPTQIRLLGYVVDPKGEVINTRHHTRIVPRQTVRRPNRAKMVLCVGTSMNSGKSRAAAACCWALSTMGYEVRASKITGTASLKDILLMEDNGAMKVSDFSYFGFPSTYMLDEKDLLHIFDSLDLKYANNPRNYWVVEIADGILQRETAMLLRSEVLRSRIHRLIFAAHDAFGAIGGLEVLRDEFGLVPDAISGVCSSSPLAVRELLSHCSLPVFNSIERDLKQIASILV